jgi:hypothetical protein
MKQVWGFIVNNKNKMKVVSMIYGKIIVYN